MPSAGCDEISDSPSSRSSRSHSASDRRPLSSASCTECFSGPSLFQTRTVSLRSRSCRHRRIPLIPIEVVSHLSRYRPGAIGRKRRARLDCTRATSATLTGSDAAARLVGAEVSAALFAALGVRPIERENVCRRRRATRVGTGRHPEPRYLGVAHGVGRSIIGRRLSSTIARIAWSASCREGLGFHRWLDPRHHSIPKGVMRTPLSSGSQSSLTLASRTFRSAIALLRPGVSIEAGRRGRVDDPDARGDLWCTAAARLSLRRARYA